MTIIAAADGSALGNPGPAGWAWYIDDATWAAGGWDHGTNNMGELQAVLELFRATEHVRDQELRILCDSQYAINCVSKWMPGWKKKGWKKADGKPVLNQDILKQLDEAIRGRNYSFEWVRGHAGHELNEAADDKARAAATAHQQGQPVDRGPGYARGASATEPAPATEAADESEPAADLAAPAQPAADVVPTIVALERAVLDPGVRASFGEYVDFLHPGYQEISRGGILLDVATVQRLLDSGRSLPATAPLQLLTGQALSDTTVLIAYRMEPEGQGLLCSSWWHLTENGWKLRFRQETVEQTR
ncbi:DUF4440 domain-containing protein [Glutamicibacter sp. MNS18]|uniref:RNase H family protein n=1 Tax=Glutamicibacter sp. MNS18 TaxID=2989817 RepID=UPI0022367949|nr:RNase H family protein [Glutamicibacter sp. MNS18]MCW4467180.1 DUF4440 domain-containing protein [Glutamicibacter sp. MNS18]